MGELLRINDPVNRFLKKQAGGVYERALQELKRGKKRGHFMWYIFPQLRGLGKSQTAFGYGIISIGEAKDYLNHPILGARLVACCEALLLHHDKTAEQIFGPIDAKKLCSSMTLFSLISAENSVFHQVLDRFFGGEPDRQTKEWLCNHDGYRIEDGVLISYYGDDTQVVIPDGVVAIGPSAFRRRREIESVVIPASVAVIDDYAFCGCFGLQSIALSEYVAVIGRGAFVGCRSLQSIAVDCNNETYHSQNDCLIETETETLIVGCQNSVIPSDGSVKHIGESAFAGCIHLSNVAIPDTVTSIGACAFDTCKSIEQIDIPPSVTAIGNDAFARCPNLTVTVQADSAAADYAQKHQVPYAVR